MGLSMLNRVAQVLGIFLFLCGTAHADAGKFTLLPKGGTVPFEATCFDNEATARLLTWKEFLVLEQQSLCEFQKERMSLDYDLIIDNLNITLDETKVRYQVEMDTRDEEIEELRKIIKKNRRMNIPAVVLTSVAVGIAVGVGATYVID